MDASMPVPAQVADYLGRHLTPPAIVPSPGGAGIVVSPARFEFPGAHAKSRERLARAAAAASGIVPDPDQLTADAVAMLQQANAEAEPGGPPGAQG